VWKYSLYLMAFLATVMNLSGCGSDEIQVHLNEEFSLSMGQYGVVSGENLKIKFKEVTEDSRCPKDVTCVWAGRATCMIELIQSELSNRMMLTEPGLTDEYTKDTYEEYELTFRVTPYPEAGKKISTDEYRLHIIVRKLPVLTKILGLVIADPLFYQGKSITVVGYYRGWDLLHETNISPPVTRSDWVVKDATGAIYVNANSEGELPNGLLPSSLEAVDTILEINGIVRVTKGGQPYIDAISIDRIP